jgi:prepilin-type N-terminal cleavage/methylation domain-containing protein
MSTPMTNPMTMPPVRRRPRRGFTLAEVMVSLVVFGIIMSAAFGFLLAQSKGFRTISTKSAQIQNGRFGRDIMRQQLRTAGTNVTDDQPIVVYANDSVFAFNSDLTTNDVDSARFTGAVYVDVHATTAEISAVSLADAFTIPGSSPGFTYPLADYASVAGTAGDAELLIFRFTRDTSSSNASDFMLLRQVNGGTPEIIATGLRKSQTTPFFRYWYDPSRYNTSLTDLDTVPRAWLPLAKTVARRGITPDTGTAPSTRIDQIRGVEVTYEATTPVNGTRNVVRYTVPMPNTAVSRQARACGRPPIAPSAASATWEPDSDAVLLSWGKAIDDGSGETDAVRYVLWRRFSGAAVWGDPLATVGVVGGTVTYRYKDAGVDRGSNRSYQYGLAVQDCTPNLSTLAASGTVVVP